VRRGYLLGGTHSTDVVSSSVGRGGAPSPSTVILHNGMKDRDVLLGLLRLSFNSKKLEAAVEAVTTRHLDAKEETAVGPSTFVSHRCEEFVFCYLCKD